MSDRARLRFQYVKHDRLAFLGHLEVITTIQRCVRRANLPFAVGNGFARRMKIQFSQALPVGASSSCEYFDLTMDERIDPAVALEMLAAASPSALAPTRAAYVDPKLAALEAWLDHSRWHIELLGEGLSADALNRAVADVVATGSIDYMRGDKPKTVDLGMTFVSFEATDAPQGVVATLDSRSTPEGALRPGILIAAAAKAGCLDGVSAATLRVRREGQWHEEDGRLVEPL